MEPESGIGKKLFGSDNYEWLRKYTGTDLADEIASELVDYDLESVLEALWGKDWLDDWFDMGFKETANNVLKPWVEDSIDPDVDSIQWGSNIEEALTAGTVGAIENLWDAIPDMLAGPLSAFNDGGILGSYAGGTDYVPTTGPYLLHEGESVNTVAETNNKSRWVEDLLEEIKDLKAIVLSGTMLGGERVANIEMLARKWDNIGIKERA